MNQESIMPDGRPLYAWRNEIAMLRAQAGRVKAARAEVDNLFRILKVYEIQKTEDPSTGDLILRIRVDAMMNEDYPRDPIKYATVEKPHPHAI